MAVNEITGFLKFKDANGNVTLLKPIATIEGLDMMEAALDATVRFTKQNLSDEEKIRARNNIGAMSADCMPEITEYDNNKLLMVQNGQFVMVPSSRFVQNEINITSITVTPDQAELGDQIESVVIKWSVNMDPVKQYFDDEEIDPTDRSKTVEFDPPLTANKVFPLEVVDDQGESVSRAVALYFKNGVYYGASAIPENIDSEFILGLSAPTLATSRSRTITVTAEEGQYIWYAQPKSFGECKFTVGGFEGGFTLVDTIKFTNGKGYTNSGGYYVYRSDEIVPGTTKVVIS